MFVRLITLRKGRPDRSSQPLQNALIDLLDERRRLSEIESIYKDFGFNELAADCRRRIRNIADKIREFPDDHPPDDVSDKACS